MRIGLLLLLLLAGLAACGGGDGGADQAVHPIVVGSKKFTESYILGEIVRQTLQREGIAAVHRRGLGNTAILQRALQSGAVDVYPEYTGTIEREMLGRGDAAPESLADLNRRLAPLALKAAVPLGFNNSYALAMRAADAARLHIASISDLARLDPRVAARLRFGLTHEFLQRADGWPGLARAYGLHYQPTGGLEHGLAYEALARGQVDVIDAYTTDAQIARLGLRVLRDDRGFFPRYDAVLLMRAALDPKPLQGLAGRIDDATMTALNAQVEIDGRTFAEVARAFVTGHASRAPRRGFLDRLLAPDLGRLLLQHLLLVAGSLALAAALGIPLGVLAQRRPRLGRWLLAGVGILQTIPALALLAILIALLGTIGFVPALLALFVYALLPIVRNTHAGLDTVGPGLVQAALALGLSRLQVLRLVELPLAAPTLLAGVKTATVINIGTATVAAFVGAGGLGERIVSGLAINDTAQMMAGAVPAALLALLAEWVFDLAAALLRRRGR
ncbi:MAG: ABC transporter permease subunit [Burkholderiales bacterium]|nr:ABC transporter permease subunit [Burkholderiales bacterium]MDE1928773.1 ABC transporter permease subunit [Burkholderiales bacterium]MDE2160041.1 ABC transporter permease subunit [Burkholderiales bacterium]MDE2504325.1 ABC transporter permease subunit [Burkholderiales bacterium]